MRYLCSAVLASALLNLASADAQDQKSSKQSKPATPAVALATSGLAGQSIAVLPLRMAPPDRRIPGGTSPTARLMTLHQADSLLADLLLERAPDATWVLPPELRRMAQRAAAMMPNPDKMGQSVMRTPSRKDMLPDPLRTYVRQLVAFIEGGRFVLIPAALYLTPGPGDSLTVQLSMVLADGVIGRVVYRTLAVGRGATFVDAYLAALDTVIPSETPPPPTP
jgi:hypothetical protein